MSVALAFREREDGVFHFAAPSAQRRSIFGTPYWVNSLHYALVPTLTECLGPWNPRGCLLPLRCIGNCVTVILVGSLKIFGMPLFPSRSRSLLGSWLEIDSLLMSNLLKDMDPLMACVCCVVCWNRLITCSSHVILLNFSESGVRLMLEVQWNPTSFSQFFQILSSFSGKARKFIWIIFTAQSWALWRIRNKFSIEGVFPNQPADCVFKTVLLLQQWRPLTGSKDPGANGRGDRDDEATLQHDLLSCNSGLDQLKCFWCLL